jgi:nitrate reductase (NAD(P)H)
MFPLGGKMSAAFEQLAVGDDIELKGPIGSFEWINAGLYRWRNTERKTKSVGMICAGSGALQPA